MDTINKSITKAHMDIFFGLLDYLQRQTSFVEKNIFFITYILYHEKVKLKIENTYGQFFAKHV